MSTCPCAELRTRPYRDARDGITRAQDADRLRPVLDKIVEGPGAVDIFLAAGFRCTVCGSLWAEGCWSSGHAEIYYLFPVETDDLAAWFRTGECLPHPPMRF